MTILMVGNFGTGWDGSICDEEHIAQALEGLGHEVTRITRKAELYPIPVREYDFTLIAQWDGYGDISHLPKPIVYWAFDYQADGQAWHEKLIASSDLYLSKRIADSKYKNWQWLSQDFAPDFLHMSRTPPKQDIDILFTGSYLPWATERNELMEAVGKKYDLVIHSTNAWPQGNLPPVMDRDLIELYARAKIILSIDHTLEAGYWSDRNAQIMACGGFTLFRYVPLSENTFHDKVAYFYNTEDCLKKIDYWFNNEEKRRYMAERGYEYAQLNLKVKNRVKDLLTIVDAHLHV